MRCAACGLTRAADALAGNRDRMAIESADGIFVVADGMGVRPGAAAASTAAVAAWVASMQALPARQRMEEARLRAALDAVNRRVRALPRRDGALAGAGTTLTALVLDADRGLVLHVGDSRLLRLRDGVLHTLTSRHTVGAEVKRLGLRRPRAGGSPLDHMLTRHLGAEPAPQAELIRLQLRHGDWLVLCSDGLEKIVTNEEIIDVFSACRDASVEAACIRLRELVERRERHDDVTAIVVRMEAVETGPGGEDDRST